MDTVQYQCWNPPQSPIRIEFPAQLLAEIAQAGKDGQGSLYGLLRGGEVRISSTAPGKAAGVDHVGFFVRRPRGEVFLTEADLKRFEGHRAAVALVIAGNRAGFFVRQADGAIQTIRSHEEFNVEFTLEGVLQTAADSQAVASPAAKPRLPAKSQPAPHRASFAPAASAHAHVKSHARVGSKSRASKSSSWPRTAAAFLAIPLGAVAYFRPAAAIPAHLELRQSAGVVIASWNPAATSRGGRMEIRDGSDNTKVEVAPGQSSLAYTPRAGNLQVQLIAGTGDGAAEPESATLAIQPPPPTGPQLEAAGLRAQIKSLEAAAAEIQASLASGNEHIDELQKTIDQLTRR